jgi:hypothetical protein
MREKIAQKREKEKELKPAPKTKRKKRHSGGAKWRSQSTWRQHSPKYE